VIISNHQSYLDIAILYGLFFHFKWVTKVGIFKIPGIGWIMTLNRYIRVDRKKKATFIQMVVDCEKAIHDGSSVLLFPEGTRSKDGMMKDFKAGPFKVAQQARASILPVVIEGSNRAFRSNNFVFDGKQVFRVKVLDPIPFEMFEEKNIKDVAREVKDMMVTEYNKMTS
jgi:1-acyl-sn-glycerol-3-phosphate acyltransferase